MVAIVTFHHGKTVNHATAVHGGGRVSILPLVA